MLLFTKNLSLTYNNNPIISDVSLSISRGDIIVIMGPNGGGKTSLIKVLCGLVEATSGIIEKADDLKIGYVPQKIKISDNLPIKVREFIKINNLNFEKTEELFSINSILDKQMNKLSSGELQLAVLFRAVSCNPDLLILDEVTSSMDIASLGIFFSLIDSIAKKKNSAVLLISHDMQVVLKTAKEIICINKKICCRGKPCSIIKDNKLPADAFGENMTLYQHKHST